MKKKMGMTQRCGWWAPRVPIAPVRLTRAKRDTQPRWSPDGKWIAFVRGPAENGAESRGSKPLPSQLALLSLSGGEAWTITDLPRSAANPVWSPDGKQMRFLCDATPEDLAKKQKKDAPASRNTRAM